MVRILVIDEDADVLAAIATLVSSRRYTVITTNDVHEAMRIHQHTPVGLVITDSFMPQIDGIGIIHAMRAGDPGLKAVTLFSESEAQPNQYPSLTPSPSTGATFTQPSSWEGLLKTIDSLTAHTA